MQTTQSITAEQLVSKRIEACIGKRIPANLIELGEVSTIVKKEEGLGVEVKNFFITAILFPCPFLGQLRVGDNILSLNGNVLVDPTKTMKILASIMGTQLSAKVTVKYFRLKFRVPRPPTFPQFSKQDGYNYETAVLWNLKSTFHFGLDIRDIDGKLTVCHIIENSLADITFSLGEAIMDIDGEKMTNCGVFQDRVTKSLQIRNYALVLLEIPATDVLKNMTRNKITTATKEIHRVYPIPNDVKLYSLEGIAVIKKNIEPKPILIEEKLKVNISRTKLDEKVKENDVPSEWNSCLFVKLPPQKTMESESGQ